MKLLRHINRLQAASRRSGVSAERRRFSSFFQMAALSRDAATKASLGHSSSRAFTMVEIAISLAVVAFALVAIIGVLPRGLNAQRDNRTESTINLDAQYWMDALRSSSRGADELTNFVRTVVVGTTTNVHGVDFTTGREIIGLIISQIANPGQVHVDAVSISGSAVEKTGPEAEVGFAYRMFVSIAPAKDISTNNAPVPGDKGRIVGNLYNVHLEFQWPLIIGTGHVGNGRQTYNGVVQADQELDADLRLLFLKR